MRKLSAIISRELFSILRNGWAMLALGGVLLIVGAAFCIAWSIQANTMGFMNRAIISRSIFYALSFALFAMMTLISPVITANAVSREREANTLDLLLCTGIPRLTILLAKWIAAVSFQLMLIILLMPLFALAFQLGGIALDEYILCGALIMQAVIVYGMVGLAVSCHFRRSATATMVAIIFVAFLCIAWPALLGIIGVIFRMSWLDADPSRGFMVVSPFSAAYTIINSLSSGTQLTFLGTLASIQGHLKFQLALFLLSILLAWRGLNHMRTPRSATALAIIDDPEVLHQRTRNFPYYLIDPLKRAQEIADDQNPILIKEKRTGALSKISTMIRITYLGAFASVFIGLGLSTNNIGDSFNSLARINLWFVMVFAPILAATSISKEREEGTLDLLLITLVPPHRIVFAKFLASLRFLLFLLLGVSTIPIMLFFMLAFMSTGNAVGVNLRGASFGFLQFVSLTLVYCASFAAVGVFISARFSRSITSILITYAALILIVAAPYSLDTANEIIGAFRETQFMPEFLIIIAEFILQIPLQLLDFLISPLSHQYWLSREWYYNSISSFQRYSYNPHIHDAYDSLRSAGVAIFANASFIVLLLFAASRRLGKIAK